MDGSEQRREAGRPEATPAGPGRVCILAVERPYVHRQGSSSYLDHLARSLGARRRRAAPAHPAAAAARPAAPPARAGLPRRPTPASRSSAPCAAARRSTPATRGTGWGALRRRRAPPDGPWALIRPEPAAAAWAAAEVARLAPDWVIANYVNAAEVFDRLPAAVAEGDPPARRLRAPRRRALDGARRAARLRRGPDRARGRRPSAPPTWCWRSSPRRRRTSRPWRPGPRSPPCPSRSTSPRPTSRPRGRRWRSSSAR